MVLQRELEILLLPVPVLICVLLIIEIGQEEWGCLLLNEIKKMTIFKMYLMYLYEIFISHNCREKEICIFVIYLKIKYRMYFKTISSWLFYIFPKCSHCFTHVLNFIIVVAEPLAY